MVVCFYVDEAGERKRAFFPNYQDKDLKDLNKSSSIFDKALELLKAQKSVKYIINFESIKRKQC